MKGKYMTPYEKAEAYDEALERASIAHKDEDKHLKATLERIFPELKESEDEMIRKCVKYAIDKLFLKEKIVCDVHKDEVLYWLEKQGKPIDEEEILIGARKRIALSIMDFLDRNTLGMCLSSMECKGLEDAVVGSDWLKVYNYMKKKLEKQDEQPNKVSIWKHWNNSTIGGNGEGKLIYLVKIGNTYSLSSCLGFECDYIELSELDKLYVERQGEWKPTDKIEPKFHEDEWITNGERTWFVERVNNGFYDIISSEGCETDDTTIHVDEYFHLWTIQDAKDGDVLYYKSPLTGIEYIVMSKGVNDYGTIDSYFRYNSKYGFGINIPSVFSTKFNEITPATKEQRDILFNKMKEAGYEWDSERRELKKSAEML